MTDDEVKSHRMTYLEEITIVLRAECTEWFTNDISDFTAVTDTSFRAHNIVRIVDN
jgi:hypothetical protein